jgi:hypothetical protein
VARDTKAQFLEQLEKFAPRIAKAFRQVVEDIRSVAQERMLIDAIERRDVEAIVRILSLGPEFFAPLDAAIHEAFVAGGMFQAGLFPKFLPGNRTEQVVVRFNSRHPRAVEYARERAAEFVQTDDESVRHAVREVITRGAKESTPPRVLARQIIGHPTPTGGRSGGLLGLTRQQVSYVENLRTYLSDPAQMDRYFDLKRRDRRLDGIVKRAQAAGQPVDPDDIERIAMRYSDRLLQLRGETIGRTEALQALNAGKAEGIAQLIEQGQAPVEAVNKEWKATPSERTRDTHSAMNKQTVAFTDLFQSPKGAFLAYPGDSSHGAPASEIINCRCSAHYTVDWVYVAKWRKQWGRFAA